MKNKNIYDWSLVSGGFDPLHSGHIKLFEEAKEISKKQDKSLFEKSKKISIKIESLNEKQIIIKRKLDLILCGFHETTLAVQEAFRRINPGERVPFGYTTSNTKLQRKLGVAD